MGIHAVTEGELTETAPEVAAVKRALLKAAASKRLLVDSSKFRPRTFMRVASVTELDEVITDEGMPTEEIERMRALGVKLTLVGVPQMSEMRILADDLTGALDTAAAFAGEVPVYLDAPAAVDASPCPVSVVATATRDVPVDSLPRLLAPSLPGSPAPSSRSRKSTACCAATRLPSARTSRAPAVSRDSFSRPRFRSRGASPSTAGNGSSRPGNRLPTGNRPAMRFRPPSSRRWV